MQAVCHSDCAWRGDHRRRSRGADGSGCSVHVKHRIVVGGEIRHAECRGKCRGIDRDDGAGGEIRRATTTGNGDCASTAILAAATLLAISTGRMVRCCEGPQVSFWKSVKMGDRDIRFRIAVISMGVITVALTLGLPCSCIEIEQPSPAGALSSNTQPWRFVASFIHTNKAGRGNPRCATSPLSAIAPSASYWARKLADTCPIATMALMPPCAM